MAWMADTGPLLHLQQAALLHLLEHEPDILTTPAVLGEWRARTGMERLPEWVRVKTPSRLALDLANDWVRQGLLDRGEAEALACSREMGVTGFLTDDTSAREFARSEGLAVRGSIGIVLMAAVRRHIVGDDARSAWNRLTNHSTLWISPALRSESEIALERILAKNA